ncbi:RNase H domain-containing protein [Trichonephila clavipes]|nr:RNase H domain-containing protein [Trichonephila clavipes]
MVKTDSSDHFRTFGTFGEFLRLAVREKIHLVRSHGYVCLPTNFSSVVRHPIHLQWVPSHVDLHRNQAADDLPKADPEDHMVLTSTEIYSRAKELIYRTWVVPPVHSWYFQRHPESATSFKGSKSYQTAFSRFSTGHLWCINFRVAKEASQM